MTTKKLVVALDIDGTQYSDAHPQWDVAGAELASTLEDHRTQHGTFLIHNTGRPWPWNTYGAPDERFTKPIIATPDAIISHGGTVIWEKPFDKPLQAWHDHIQTIAHTDVIEKMRLDLTNAGLAMHPETFTNEFKTCCILNPARRQETRDWISAHLTQNYPGQFEISYWNDYTLDIAPTGIHKDSALQFFLKHAALTDRHVVAAGDELNDLPVLKNESYHRVLVGNASDRLKQAVPVSGNLYVAPADQPAALAVLAGMRHFGFLPQPPQPQVKAPAPSPV